MRGKRRLNPPGYHASRGWFYHGVQKVISEWDPILGREITQHTFQQVCRTMERGIGSLSIEIYSPNHRKFVCELMAALDELHNHENSYGWVVKLWPAIKSVDGKHVLLTYSEMRQRIIELGGPQFTEESLKQAARRMKMIVPRNQIDKYERLAHNLVVEE
jgi:hypothetical protein